MEQESQWEIGEVSHAIVNKPSFRKQRDVKIMNGDGDTNIKGSYKQYVCNLYNFA